MSLRFTLRNATQCTLLAILAVLGLSERVVAQPKDDATGAAPIYQPIGAPADPKVEARWNFYRDYRQATELLKQIAAAHPDLCRMQSLGKSHGGREMWQVTITNFKETDDQGKKRTDFVEPDKRPGFWIDGGIHANEVQAVDVVLYTAWYLTEMYGRSEFVTQLLDDRVFYLVPMMSPDSRDAHMHKPNTGHSPRTGQRPVDDDGDGRFDEDGPDDLDKDGHITQMRIRDPHGRYKAHPKYPNMMQRVAPGEKGEYALLGSEGVDNDGDGNVNEDGDGYYDPNRDWAWTWEPGYIQRGAYRYPFSILENRMVADFVMTRPNIGGAQSYHNTGGMLLRPPGVKSKRLPAADLAVYTALGEQGEEILPGYKLMATGEELYEVFGGELDWFYGMQGVFCFTNELHTPFNWFRKATGGGFFGPEEVRHKFDKYLLMGDGFVPWKEIDHPKYGKIEVGGQKKNWGRQPPSFMLEEECHRNMAFTLFHADQLAQVEIEGIDVQDLGHGLTQVTATLMNPKLTPTHSAHDVANKITPPDRVTISGEDLEVLTAMTDRESRFENPVEQKRSPEEVRLSTIPSRQPVFVRWLVRGKLPFTVTVDTLKGGSASKTVTAEDGTKAKAALGTSK